MIYGHDVGLHISGKEVAATNDKQIIALLTERDETALKALSEQYGGTCRRIAVQILRNDADAEEVVNDALMAMWNAIPPAMPEDLSAYLCTTVRNLSRQRLEKRGAQKRGGGLSALSLDNLSEQQQPSANSVEQAIDEAMMLDAVNRFLATVPPDARTVFIERYGNHKTVAEIAAGYHISRNGVALRLMRTRKKLRKFLSEEGWL